MADDPTFRRTRGGVLAPVRVAATFEGGSRVPGLSGWDSVPDHGPNTAAQFSLREMRARSRQQVRDNGVALSASEQFVTNVVGTGIRPKLTLPDAPDLQEEIMALWNQSVAEMDADGRCDFYGLQALAATSIFDSGEVLARRRPRRLSDRLAVPLQIQLIEPDHLDDLTNRRLGGGRELVQGIELDALGRRVAYRLFRTHPGEYLSPRVSAASSRVPADDIAHVFKIRRPGQLRGVPALHAVLVKLYMLDQYQHAELERKKQAAMKVGFLVSDGGDMHPEDVFPTDEGQNWAEARASYYRNMGQIRSGSWTTLAPGDDVRFNEPSDVGDTYMDFVHEQKREIAAAAGVTFEQLTGYMRGVNYSSARVRLIDIRRRFEMDQHQVLAHQFCRRVWRWWMDSAVAAGRLRIPDYDQNPARYMPGWVPDAFDSVDPLKDLRADVGEVRAGFASRSAKQVERGNDPDVTHLEIQRENELADERGFVFDSDPRKTTVSGAYQGPDDPEDDE